MQNCYLFVGAFTYSVDVLHEVDLEEVGGSEGKQPGATLAERKLKWRVGEGDFDVLGLSGEGFYLEVSVALEANQFF